MGTDAGKLVVRSWQSVDGVVQAPGLADEDRSGGFEHGGWVPPYFDADMGRTLVEHITRADAMLFGRKTYETFVGYWPHVGEDDHDGPIASQLNSAPKYVVSTTLREPLGWRNAALLTGDLPEAVSRLKERYGEIHVTGSAQLVQALLRHDLVDEYVLWVFPLLLGTGKRLFAEGTGPAGLRLADSTTSATGVAMHTYERVR